MPGSGFRVQGSGFRVQGSGFRVQGSGTDRDEARLEEGHVGAHRDLDDVGVRGEGGALLAWDVGCGVLGGGWRVEGEVCRVYGVECRVQGAGCRVKSAG